jgi:glyoxylase-like metal-dependent hydrolase (beta-lactamase superfamily II)
LLSGGTGLTGDAWSSRSALDDSVRRKLLVLPDETVVHPGHGYDTGLGTERVESWAGRI